MENKKPSQEELLKAVADVLDEALVEYEKLTKTGEGIDNAQAIDDLKGQGKAVIGDGEGQKPMMAKEEPAPAPVEEKDESKEPVEPKEDEEEEEDDEKLMENYKKCVEKMEKRGLKIDVKKSENADESLKKSVDDRFESLTKALKEVSDTVKKIASTPVRKGITGLKPLRKNEGDETSLKKSEVLGKLLDLRKSGDKNVDSLLINRVETGRLVKGDVERLKSLNVLSE